MTQILYVIAVFPNIHDMVIPIHQIFLEGLGFRDKNIQKKTARFEYECEDDVYAEYYLQTKIKKLETIHRKM